MSISDRLDQIEARADAATEGSWWGSMIGAHVEIFAGDGSGHDPLLASEVRPGDAEFIASARTDVPAMLAALRAVLDLHKPRGEQVLATDCSAETCDCEDGCQTVPIKVCEHCMDLGNSAHHYAYEEGGIETVLWPCPTVRAIEVALGEGS